MAVNQKIRDAYNQYGIDHELTIVFLDNEAYDNSIVGITASGNLIYSYQRMVAELAQSYFEADDDDLVTSLIEQEGYSEDEAKAEALNEYTFQAVEWIDYNTIRALSYIENGPIILQDETSMVVDVYSDN